jgi:hypothetical protein
MAARTVSLTHHAEIRKRIQAVQLINRLQGNAMGTLSPHHLAKGQIELTMGQIRSIEILLRKCLPDLSSVIMSGDPERPIVHRIERLIIEPSR